MRNEKLPHCMKVLTDKVIWKMKATEYPIKADVINYIRWNNIDIVIQENILLHMSGLLCRVHIHFITDSTETTSDKIKRRKYQDTIDENN